MNSAPRVFSIAGTDPSGGAGIHADLKTIGALGGYGMAAVTGVVAQNTQGVRAIHAPPAAVLRQQLDAVSDDVRIDAVKLGMLHSTPLIDVVADWLARVEPPIVVLDPVMVATSGDRLLDEPAESAVRELCRRAHLVTPNLSELAVLVGAPRARHWDDAVTQARRLAADAATTVLLKGGHLAAGEGDSDSDTCPDAIVTADGIQAQVDGVRLTSRNTHGTGCSLSSAMATLRATGLEWGACLERAKAWLTGAISHGAALEVGSGHGPIDHFHELRPLANPSSATTRAWTEHAWTEHGALRADVDGCAFVRGLRDGSLPPSRFAWYLEQDALYLVEYSRALARASALAPSIEEQVFWAEAARSALVTEMDLHRAHAADGAPPPAAPSTRAYVDHLHAVAGTHEYAVLVAALLPCFWLYSDVGLRLTEADHDEHPFHDWLRTYAEPAFAEATSRAVSIADDAARSASAAGRRRMGDAFARSMRHELAFFEAPMGAEVSASAH